MSTSATVPWIDAEEVVRLLPLAVAIDVVEAALRDGLDPGADTPRVPVTVPAGQLLLMPSSHAAGVGVKIASVAPANPARGLPRVHAVHVLLDPASLAPVALLDGTALTELRTPAVSAVAVRHLADHGAHRLALFGTGPQAWGHVVALRAVRPLTDVAVVGRDAARTAAFAARVTDLGLDVTTHGPEDVTTALADAHVVVCATSAATPLFRHEALPADCCVVAIGSHERERRELPPALLAHAAIVVVEDVATAMREAGDVWLAARERAIARRDLRPLAAVVRREVVPPRGGQRVFKGVGMAWQDLVVAAAVHHAWLRSL